MRPVARTVFDLAVHHDIIVAISFKSQRIIAEIKYAIVHHNMTSIYNTYGIGRKTISWIAEWILFTRSLAIVFEVNAFDAQMHIFVVTIDGQAIESF
ncbi:MAG: hypothetical protein IPJ51_01825 [Saprospiraceae bacterium]|nr:hypothetical protein [Saprospiraceae bacterium]